ncbi:MAG: hypothetical protein K2Q15_03470, partial [Burkholderiales bacterium]|nr:hypothetical protein [Burkholderiales bacterium]
ITVTLTPQWQGLPEGQDFATWYAGYTGKPENDNVFTVRVDSLNAGVWTPLNGGNPLLFEDNAETAVAPTGAALTFSFPGLLCDAVDSDDPNDWSSQLRLALDAKTFLHQEYWQRVSAGTAVGMKQPYTPQWGGFSITYHSTQEIGSAAQYALTPFGHQAAGAVPDTALPPQLYLGFANMRPGQQLSLYWKLQSPQPLVVDWQYLNEQNEWASLNADVLDDTNGLFASGLWSATLPHDASDQAAQMPAKRHWLRGSMQPSYPSEGDDTLSDYPLLQEGLLANVMTATLANADAVAAEHFARPLSAGSVSQTVVPIPGLAAVRQPWPSHSGRAEESPVDFNRRVAHSLSHRGRAVRRCDLQTLLRECFPEVGAVILRDGVATLGSQYIDAIPAPGQGDNADPLRPTFNPARLARMREAMRQRTPPWAEIIVSNPIYQDVAVAYNVAFDAAISPDYGYRQLELALQRHYLPWVFDTQVAITVGGTLDYYQMLAFIQQQPYVSCVNDLTLDGAKESISATEYQVLVPEKPTITARPFMEPV